MRLMSFALTTDQIRNQTKTVTRRVGWKHLEVGTLLQPIVKGQGLKKGEKVQKIGGPIRVVRVTREWMSDFDSADECAREGFPEMAPDHFRSWFITTHGGSEELAVTRIEFEYTANGAHDVEDE